jgi:hypothetical protein
MIGAPCPTRTDHLLITNQLLDQMSEWGIDLLKLDFNLLHNLQSGALALGLGGFLVTKPLIYWTFGFRIKWK